MPPQLAPHAPFASTSSPQLFDEDEEDASIDVGVLREVSMLRMLNGTHPNVMKLIDMSELEGSLCMIMPKLAGDLTHAIKVRRAAVGWAYRF